MRSQFAFHFEGGGGDNVQLETLHILTCQSSGYARNYAQRWTTHLKE